MQFDPKQLTQQQTRTLIRLVDELPFYSEKCLKIVDKTGTVQPFVLNQAQLFLHKKLEEQRIKTGMVRAVICKGRQLGCTTYIQARYFHRTQTKSNQSAFILSHEAKSTDKIYAMTKTFASNLPAFKMDVLIDNERRMAFENGSNYSVGTAKAEDTGRGTTVQLFHGSEAAFYERTDQLSTGILQAVAELPGTELIIESTSNGPGNWYYNLVQMARAGKGGFILIFIPWYWSSEYILDEQITLTPEEEKLLELYGSDGLTVRHLAWRRRKIETFEGKVWRFQQEYPMNVDESFVNAVDKFFELEFVYAAKKRKEFASRNVYPLIIGVDQGRTGDDTQIARRIGPIVLPIQTIKSEKGENALGRDMRLAGILAMIIEREDPEMIFIDTTNEHGTLDRLWELGYKRRVRGIHFGEHALDRTRHRNKRVEMYASFREWLAGSDSQIPDDDQLLVEIGAIPREQYTSNSVMYLVSKDDIRAILGWSPDKLESVILTFAYPVKKSETRLLIAQAREAKTRAIGNYQSSLRTLGGLRNGMV